MYEFLAPWGVLVPAISASVVYLFVSQQRWRRQVKQFEQQGL